jgi:hypothetical protein
MVLLVNMLITLNISLKSNHFISNWTQTVLSRGTRRSIKQNMEFFILAAKLKFIDHPHTFLF